MLDPFGYSPLRLAPGRDLYQPNQGPHGCSEPGGRPGAGRLNGSNGPTKLVHFITKRIFLMLAPFGYSPLRLAPGRDLYQPNLGPHGCLEPGGRPGAGRLNGSNGPTKLVHFITKRIFLMLDPFGYSPLRLAPGRDLYQPNLGPHGCLEPGGRPGQASEWVKWTNEIGAFHHKTDILDVGPVWIFAPTACPRTGPIPAQSRSPWVLGTRRSSWGRPSEWVKWTNEIGAFHHKTDILDVGPVWIFAPTACPRTGPIPAQSRSPWVLGTRRSSWGRPSEWVKWTNEIGAFHHKTDILDVGPVWIFAPTACPRTGPIPAQSRSPWVLGTRRSSWGRPSEWVKWTNEIGAFHHKTDILDVGPVWIFAPTACPRTGPIPAQSRSPWVLGTRRSSWGRPSEWVKWTNEIGAFHHKTDILDVGPVWIFAPTACPRTGPIPAQSRSPWVLGTRRSSWGRPSEWVKWTNEIGAFHHKTDILDVGPVWIFAPTACPRTGPIPAQSRSPWVLGTRRSSWGRPSEWVKWTNEIGAFHHKTDILDVGPVWIFAPTACPRTGPIPAQSRSPWVLGTRRSSWGRPSEWVKWTNEIGAFHHKTDILDVGPVWIFAPTACPRTGPIPAQSRSPWVLGTRRSSWGRPSEWVKWTNEIGAFHHKTDILDVGPVWIFAPTACPRTGPIPAQSRSPWVLGTRRSSWGRPSEWVKWTNEIGAFHHKTDILDVGPVWIFAPTACPRTGPIPANLGPHGCLEPGGRPGAGRLNGSNGPTKLVHFITKRIFLMLDPFGYSPLRLAPGRDLYQPNLSPHGCLEPGGRPGAGRLNGSNGPTKLVHFITKRIFLMLDPFGYSPLRLAPGRDLYQPNLGPHGCLEPGGRPGAGRLNGSNGPTKLVHFITKRIFLMLDPFGYSPLRLAPGRDLYQPNQGPHGCSEPGGRPGAGRLNGSNGPTKLVHFITKRIFLMLAPFGYSPLRLAPGRDLYQPNLGPHGCLEPGGRPGAGRLNGSNGPTKLVHFITKRIFLMLDPFGYSPLRLAPGRDLYQPNLGPHGCLEPGGRPGAGRLNGSNGPTKLVHFITKRIFLMLDPFGYSPLRLAPGRDLYQPNLGPHGCLEPGGRPGAGRLNGSNGPTKLVHFITKRIFLMLAPFGYSPLRLAPGRDLYQPNLGPHGCLEPGGRPGAGRLNGSNGPTKLVHFITKRIFLMLDPFGYSPLRLAPGRDLYQPNLGPHGCLEPGGRPGAGRLNGQMDQRNWCISSQNGYS